MDEEIKKLQEIIDNSNRPDNFVASIEATFDTLTDEKINVLKNSNFKRIIQNRNKPNFKQMLTILLITLKCGSETFMLE